MIGMARFSLIQHSRQRKLCVAISGKILTIFMKQFCKTFCCLKSGFIQRLFKKKTYLFNDTQCPLLYFMAGELPGALFYSVPCPGGESYIPYPCRR